MPPVPVLRVVSLERVHRHEAIDPFRVNRLTERIDAEGIQVNPMVCAEAPDGDLVLFDGATRSEALKQLGLEHAVVQVVEPLHVKLETWHHVIRECAPDKIVSSIEAESGLTLTEVKSTPRIHLTDDTYFSVTGDTLSANATLSALVDIYIGRWTVGRVIDPATDSVGWRFPDWGVIVEFPTLTVDDVIKAAKGKDLLPAGITRFIVDDRALRLNVDLELLRSSRSREEKQQALDLMLGERAQEGRIRRYEEPVFILDD